MSSAHRSSSSTTTRPCSRRCPRRCGCAWTTLDVDTCDSARRRARADRRDRLRRDRGRYQDAGHGRAGAARRDQAARPGDADPADHRPRRPRPGGPGAARRCARLRHKPIDREYFVASLSRRSSAARWPARIELQRLELERHSHVLEHVGDGVFVVDRDHVVQLWNLAAERITGHHAGPGVSDGMPGRCSAAGRRSRPRFRSPAAAGPSATRSDAAVRGRRPRAVAVPVRCGRGDATVYSFRTDRRAGRRQAQGRVRRDGIARAPHAAGRDLRRGEDARAARAAGSRRRRRAHLDHHARVGAARPRRSKTSSSRATSTRAAYGSHASLDPCALRAEVVDSMRRA